MMVLMSNGSGFLDAVPKSDTLFGAICWAVRWIEGEGALVELLGHVDAGDPPFLVSSAFPYADYGGRRTFFLPRPMLPPPATGRVADTPVPMKVLRRIRWVSASLFEDIVAGRMDTARISGGLASGEYRAEGQALARNGEGLPNLVEAELDRNGIDPLSGAVREGLLFTSRVLAAGGGGYYCLVRPRHPGAGQRIAAAFRLLADRGVGGDSSVGRGHFSVTIEEGEPFHAPADGQVLCTLALFHPTAEDLSHLAARREWVRCSLEMRRGRLEQMYAHHARIWKPRLLYLSEGSFFPPAGNREVYGSAPVVLEEPFRVRQNGFAFPVRMRHAVPL